jgi:hypothetical protein
VTACHSWRSGIRASEDSFDLYQPVMKTDVWEETHGWFPKARNTGESDKGYVMLGTDVAIRWYLVVYIMGASCGSYPIESVQGVN